ncbi:MAG: N-acetylmuramoyl-L-alanine amidase [Lachnospiraceae bacterium]|nr:N-acetylmuramoyl-L-alanine amidase [Lachnospiraceae bacterium]
MKKIFKTDHTAVIVLLLSLMMIALLGGCKKDDEEQPTVTSHDFTVEQWADFIDKKKENEAAKAAEAGSGESSSSDGQAGSEKSSDNSSGNKSDSTGNDDGADTKKAKTVVIVIDPGHGGKFTGAVYNKVNEKEITLKTAKYARDYLNENYENVEVYLTRDEDTELAETLKEDLEERARIAKRKGADALVSIHFNASDDHKRNGCYIYVSRRKEVADECKGLAKAIMKEITDLGVKEKAIEQRKSNDMFDETGDPYDYYAINRHCAARNIPGIIVESCFMDNETDRQFIDSEMALKTLGEANAKGIAAYFELVKKAD